MEIIKENLKRCDAFYQSDFYQFLKKNNPNYIPYLFDHLCEDPDARDRTLYHELSNKFEFPARKDHLMMRLKDKRFDLQLILFVVENKLLSFTKMIMKSGEKIMSLFVPM
ncbi:Uncharacterised protein [Streptococcus pneumoniae]|nr:Uncharacterised protein [Streptococcus pneumoniae]